MTLERVNEWGEMQSVSIKDRTPVERVRPLTVGDTAPFFSLTDRTNGWLASVSAGGLPNTLTLSDLLKRGPGYPGREPTNPYARIFFGFWALTALALAGFRTENPTYREQLDQWHRQRVESLRSENGWLNVAGLFWLKEGANEAGTDPGHDLTFPADRAPAQLGTFVVAGGIVTFNAAPGAVVQADGAPVLSPTTIFAPGGGKPVTLSHGSLRWFIIKRGARYAVRLRDLDSPVLKTFWGIERFPADEHYRVQARLERPVQPRTIPILDITGQISQQLLVGTLVFDLDGKTHRLDAVGEGSNKLFILFGDATNAHDTYGSGRFLYADLPARSDGPADGLISLDFNQSINPPCQPALCVYGLCNLPAAP